MSNTPEAPLSGLLGLPVLDQDHESAAHEASHIIFSSHVESRTDDSGITTGICCSQRCSNSSSDDREFLTARTRATSVRWNLEDEDDGGDSSDREPRLSAFSMHLAKYVLLSNHKQYCAPLQCQHASNSSAGMT